jgi:enoyl-CoA hydratase
MTDNLIISQDGPVTLIQLNRPQKRNAIDKATAIALRTAILDFEAAENARVLVITGGPEVFSAGADLHDSAAILADVQLEGYGPLEFGRLMTSKPSIAAVAGHAVAGGFELALWCDIRIAAENAVFGWFQRRFGLPFTNGGSQRLAPLVGLGRAQEITLTGRPVPAEEALAIGLVTEVVPPEKLIAHAMELAQRIASFPQTCLRNDRRSVYESWHLSMEEGLKLETEMGLATLASGEAKEGAQRFQKGEGRGGKFE